MVWCVVVGSVELGLHFVAHLMGCLWEVVLGRSECGGRSPVVLATKVGRLETRLTLRMQDLDIPSAKTGSTLFSPESLLTIWHLVETNEIFGIRPSTGVRRLQIRSRRSASTLSHSYGLRHRTFNSRLLVICVSCHDEILMSIVILLSWGRDGLTSRVPTYCWESTSHGVMPL